MAFHQVETATVVFLAVGLFFFFQYTLQTCKSGFLSFVLEVFSFLLQLITQNLQDLSPSPFFLRAQEMQG